MRIASLFLFSVTTAFYVDKLIMIFLNNSSHYRGKKNTGLNKKILDISLRNNETKYSKLVHALYRILVIVNIRK